MKMNWDLLIKAFGTVFGIVVGIYQIRNMLPRQRMHLRADPEILKLLENDDPNRNLVGERVRKQIQAIYDPIPRHSAWTVGHVGNVAVGFIWAAGFSYWSFYESRNQFNSWSIVTGIIGLLGVFFAIGVLAENKTGAHS